MPALVVVAFMLAGAQVAAAANPPVKEYSTGLAAGSGPNVITRGPDGAMWFTEFHGTHIGRIADDGTITEYPSAGLAAGADGSGIVTGPDGNIWFTEFGTDKIGELNPTTGLLVGEYSVPTAGSKPQGITVGPDGDLWFVESGNGLIGRIDPAHPTAITEYKTKQVDAYHSDSGPTNIVTGPDGNLWITMANGIDRLVIASAAANTLNGFTYFTLPTPGSVAEGITVDPGGTLWFAELNASKVVSLDTAGAVENTTSGMAEYPATGGPLLVTVAAGDLWFTEQGSGLMRFSPTAFTSTTLTAADGISSDANGDATDNAGNIWFTEFNAAKIGVVLLAGAALPTPGAPTIGATPRQGEPKACNPDAAHWTGSPVFSYQWLLNGAAIPGATSATYTPVATDVLGSLACRVTGSNSKGAVSATSAAATVGAPVAPPATTPVTTPATPPPPAPTAHLVDQTPTAAVGGKLVVSAATSLIPPGQTASTYTFTLGTTTRRRPPARASILPCRSPRRRRSARSPRSPSRRTWAPSAARRSRSRSRRPSRSPGRAP